MGLWEYGVASLYSPLYASFVYHVGVALTLDGKGCLRSVFPFFLSQDTREQVGFIHGAIHGAIHGEMHGAIHGAIHGVIQ